MNTSTKADFLLPGGLLLLGAVPVAAGAARLFELIRGAEITAENARFFAAPLPVVLHIVGAALFAVGGAVQFSAGNRRRFPRWHRVAGGVVVAGGLIAALSALWMTLSYPLGKLVGPAAADFDGRALALLRLIVALLMLLSLGLGVVRIFQRDFPAHGAWMMRAYAIGLGAGTQVFTHVPWFLFPAIRGETARWWCMAAGWAINMAGAEWLIARASRRRAAASPGLNVAMQLSIPHRKRGQLHR